MFQDVYAVIENLLKSEITSYRIQKDTGVRQQMIDRYRKGQSDLKNMTLDVAEKLYNYASSIKKAPPIEGGFPYTKKGVAITVTPPFNFSLNCPYCWLRCVRLDILFQALSIASVDFPLPIFRSFDKIRKAFDLPSLALSLRLS
ncbi:hypothetical protein D3H64_05960 [Atopobacter sp. AH10]|nr:hypothetical protein D3H64_05960 [Atopobacter sp. AH10]